MLISFEEKKLWFVEEAALALARQLRSTFSTLSILKEHVVRPGAIDRPLAIHIFLRHPPARPHGHQHQEDTFL